MDEWVYGATEVFSRPLKVYPSQILVVSADNVTPSHFDRFGKSVMVLGVNEELGASCKYNLQMFSDVESEKQVRFPFIQSKGLCRFPHQIEDMIKDERSFQGACVMEHRNLYFGHVDSDMSARDNILIMQTIMVHDMSRKHG